MLSFFVEIDCFAMRHGDIGTVPTSETDGEADISQYGQFQKVLKVLDCPPDSTFLASSRSAIDQIMACMLSPLKTASDSSP
jgi:hypothetical protein